MVDQLGNYLTLSTHEDLLKHPGDKLSKTPLNHSNAQKNLDVFDYCSSLLRNWNNEKADKRTQI